jgi:hypothetical protein
MVVIRYIFKISVVTCTLLFAACSPVYYSPTAPVLSGFEKKGDLSITAGAGYADKLTTVEFLNREPNVPAPSGSNTSLEGADFSIAYSPFDHIGVHYNMTYFYGSEREDSRLNERYSGNGLFHNIGIGFYEKLEGNIIWETYANLGIGNVDIESNAGRNLNASISKLGAHTGLLYKKRSFEMGGLLSLSRLKYSSINGSLEFQNVSQAEYLLDNDAHLLLEPAIIVRAGHKNVKFQFSLANSTNLTNIDFRQNNLNASFGVQLAFNAMDIR